jgi:DNA-binding transcriptional regulator YdaS (Cro superfamily)
MANTQVIQLDGVISDVQNVQLQTESSNTILQLGDRYDYAIDSAILFGSPTTIFIAYPNAIDSTLAFGTAKLNTTIYATSVESTVSFGDSAPKLSIAVNSTVNQETFGTAQLNSRIYANSVTSISTVSQPNVRPAISPVSIASSEAFGVAKINMQIDDVPFPSIESTLVVSNPSVRFVIGPLGIAPTNNFGTATFIDNIHRLLVFKDDNISKVGENDAVVIAGGIRVNPASAVSETAVSGSATLPNNPVGFVSVNIAGRDYLMPYYNA